MGELLQTQGPVGVIRNLRQNYDKLGAELCQEVKWTYSINILMDCVFRHIPLYSNPGNVHSVPAQILSFAPVQLVRPKFECMSELTDDYEI